MRTGLKNRVELILHTLVFSSLLTYSMNAQTPAKIWSLDLSMDPDFQKRLKYTDPFLTPPTLDFIGHGKIIVSFTDNLQSVPTLERPQMLPFGFHVLQVDGATGKAGKRLDFSVLTDAVQAMAIADGNFVVLAGEELRKFSDSFEETNSIPIPLELHGQPTTTRVGERTYLNPHYESWEFDVAPGGKDLVLAHISNPQSMELRWVNTNDLKTSAVVQAQPSRKFSAGNNAVLLFQYEKLLVMSSGQQARFCTRCLRAYFLTDDLVFVDDRDKYLIRTVAGDKRNEGSLNKEVLKFYRAVDAPRFAYATGSYKGSGFPLQTHFAPQITVRAFDWQNMKQIAELKLAEQETPASDGFAQSAIAISPDGTLLVVLVNSTLTLYKLP